MQCYDIPIFKKDIYLLLHSKRVFVTFNNLLQLPGIEPGSQAWKARILTFGLQLHVFKNRYF